MHLNFGNCDSFVCPDELLCIEDQIFEMLSSFYVKKANSRAARMLKSTARSIAYGITLLFNNSIYITTGQIPKAWNVSSAFPVPKGFEVISVSNCRLTSRLPVVSKLSAVSALIDVLHASLVHGTSPKKRGCSDLF